MNEMYETIYSNDGVVIPMADVSHIEKRYKNSVPGGFVVMKHTTYNIEFDDYNNAIWLSKENLEKFIKAYCYFRYQVDSNSERVPHKEKTK